MTLLRLAGRLLALAGALVQVWVLVGLAILHTVMVAAIIWWALGGVL